MAFWNKKPEPEARAEPSATCTDLLEAQLFGVKATKQKALEIPTISGAIDIISGIIASTPICLYRENDGKSTIVKGDRRVFLLNDEPGDTLNANEMWRSLVRDYFVGKGGYLFINKRRGKIESLHYVDEESISIEKNVDPVFKDYKILINGNHYEPYSFFRILRNTKDGCRGVPITEENAELINMVYETLCFETAMVRKGGQKKGFISTDKPLDENVFKRLKAAFASLFRNDSENVLVLPNGAKYNECSSTSVEMQLNENKNSNAEEMAKLFHISTDCMAGKKADLEAVAKIAARQLMDVIQCELNRSLLRENEKGSLYFAFDTKDLLKGDLESRYRAYKLGIESNMLQIDEARFQEDMEPLGIKWIKLGLNDVLYNPETGEVYTPNTNKAFSVNNGKGVI